MERPAWIILLEMEILQLISELMEMLCWCTGYGDDSIGKVDISSILPIWFCEVFIRHPDRFEPFLVSGCAPRLEKRRRDEEIKEGFHLSGVDMLEDSYITTRRIRCRVGKLLTYLCS